MSQNLSTSSQKEINSINPEKSSLLIENSDLNDTESLIRLGSLARLHTSTGVRTISAGAVIPTRTHNLAKFQTKNHSLDQGYYSNSQTTHSYPLSYNLRNAKESHDSPILSSQYLPSPSSSMSTPTSHNYMSISTSSSAKQISNPTYNQRLQPQSPHESKNNFISNEIRRDQNNHLQQPYQTVGNSIKIASRNAPIQRTTGTVIPIPETDILDSSCSDDEDDAVRAYGEEKYGSDLALNNGEEEDAVSSSEDINDPEYLELCEREQIVEKYDRGPDAKDVDPWENPDFELYKITDRYGFIHKSSLTDSEKEAIKRELNREFKWYKMLDEWKKRLRIPIKLSERIWKGAPDKLRAEFWKRLLSSDELKQEAPRNNMYKELLMRARLVSRDIKQIDLDINRTYRDNLAFRRRYDVKQQSLFNVLSAYAMYNTEVGYCQGMSQIAALFLLYMDEEEAFWCLHSLMVQKKFGMHGFFVPGFPKLHRFQEHYEKIIQKYLPRLKKHFDKTGIPPIYLTKWWFGCFLDRVPFPLALRVWDVFLFYGDTILLAMSYNIIKMHQKTIRKLQMENFMEFIQNGLEKDFGYPPDKVMDSLNECLRKLQSDKMDLPPPAPHGAPEAPTKQLGPVLYRSMMDIQMDLAEIQSRCSRANSLAGTPGIHRRTKNSSLWTPKTNYSLKDTRKNYSEGRHERSTSHNDWHSTTNQSHNDERILPPTNSHIMPSHSRTPTNTQLKNSHLQTPINTNNRRSYYDNVPSPSESIPDPVETSLFPMHKPAEGSSFHGSVRGIEQIHSSMTPIQYTHQHITYIAVGDEQAMPLNPKENRIHPHFDSMSKSFSQSMQQQRNTHKRYETINERL